jgi:transposase
VAGAGPEPAALRAELAELRAQNAELRLAHGVLAEEYAGMREVNATLAEQNRVLAEHNRVLAERIAELERRLDANPRNSHRPPSSEGYAKPPPRSRRTRSGRQPGGQPGSAGTTLAQVADPDEVRTHRPRRCSGCRRSLRRAPVTSTEARQVADLPEIRLRWTEHRIEHRRCRCGTTTMAGAGDGVPATAAAPVQYGPGVRAAGVFLVGGHHLPLDRAAEVMSALVAAPVSPGSLAGWLARAAAGLGGFATAVRQALTAAEVVHLDETGLRVDGRLSWVHSASTAKLSLFTVHARRGVEAMTAAGVLPAMTGVAVHDGWKPYRHYPLTHALCNAHHLRELAALADDPGQGWAPAMIDLLVGTHRRVEAAKAAGGRQLDPTVLADLQARYRATLAVGRTDNPAPAGRRRRTTARNLIDRLTTYAEDVLRFTVDFRVPFDNNQAERDLRMVKLRQKVSGCLRSWTGAEAFCVLRSYLSTAAKQGQPALAALRAIFEGHAWLPSAGRIS